LPCFAAGIADLKSGKIVTPLPPKETFLDDPLRVLRAIRFGMCTGLNIFIRCFIFLDLIFANSLFACFGDLLILGARFSFVLDEALKEAAASDEVRSAIADKISRERIGHEVCSAVLFSPWGYVWVLACTAICAIPLENFIFRFTLCRLI